MKVVRKSPLTGKTNVMNLDVTHEQLVALNNGALIQDVMPQLSNSEREFIISGCHADEFDKMFLEIE